MNDVAKSIAFKTVVSGGYHHNKELCLDGPRQYVELPCEEEFPIAVRFDSESPERVRFVTKVYQLQRWVLPIGDVNWVYSFYVEAGTDTPRLLVHLSDCHVERRMPSEYEVLRRRYEAPRRIWPKNFYEKFGNGCINRSRTKRVTVRT